MYAYVIRARLHDATGYIVEIAEMTTCLKANVSVLIVHVQVGGIKVQPQNGR